MKKRVLSLVLAFALVISLLPSFSFAVDESEPSGVYVTYDFVGAYNATQGTDLTKYDYTHTNGFWSVDGIINGFVKEGDVRGPTMHKSNGITVRYNGSVAALKINVPKSGVYNAIKMKTSSFTNSTKALDVYILKGDTVLSADYDLSSFTPVADDVNLYAPFGADGITTASENINVTISKYLDAGEYYLVFKNVGTTNADKADSYTRIHSLTLSGGSELAIMAESTPFVGSLKKYEARKIALKNLFMSDGSVINPSDITATYSSRDTGIATVSGAGLVTGVSEGETVIDITVAYNGKTKNIEHKVSVGNDSLEVSGVYVNYEFVAAYDATPGTDLTAYTYDHSNEFWSGEKIVNGYESSSSTYGPTMNSSYGLFLRYIGSRAAIKINVPKSGYYNSIRMYTNSVKESTSALDI